MSDIAQLVANQIETQVQILVKERLGEIVGELNTMLEERAHAHEMIMDMDRKIAERLGTLRSTVASFTMPPVVAAVPTPPAEPPPEPVPAPRPDPSPPPLPPAADEAPAPEPEPAALEPVSVTPPPLFKSKRLRDVLVEIAEANGGILKVREAREQLTGLGLLTGTTKVKAKAISNVVYHSPRFEKGDKFGEWRLRPADAPPPPRSSKPRKPSKKIALEAAVLETVKATGRGEFNSLDIRDKLMGTAALTSHPVKASQALSAFLHTSGKFEKVARGKWRLVEQPRMT